MVGPASPMLKVPITIEATRVTEVATTKTLHCNCGCTKVGSRHGARGSTGDRSHLVKSWNKESQITLNLHLLRNDTFVIYWHFLDRALNGCS